MAAVDLVMGPAAAGTPAPRCRTWVWIDVAATCNLSCELCYTTALRSKAKMSMTTFADIVDKLAEPSLELVAVHLNWRGEPTSNPLLPEMLSYAAARGLGCRIQWHTNGTMLSRERADRLVAATPDQTIYVSLDGGNAASFEATRGVGNWPRAVAGLEALLAARGDRREPSIGIYQLDLGVSEHEYDERFRALIEQVDEYHRVEPIEEDGGMVNARSGAPFGPCFWLGNALAFDCAGNAFTCLLASATKLGSILDTSASELLDRAAALRNIVSVGGRRSVTGCRHCRKCEGSAVEPL